MNGPYHYIEAERLVKHSQDHTDSGDPRDQAIAEVAAAQAQVHATLALAAATEQTGGPVIPDEDVMRCDHGMVICGLCGYGVPMGGRS